jgi:translation initiation factor IF-3
LKINDRIRADKVRLIDESNNQLGIVKLYEALGKARETGMDLVEVAPTSDPPVCRIMDYGKWLYQQERKIREAHKKHHYHTMTTRSSSPFSSAADRCSTRSGATQYSPR